MGSVGASRGRIGAVRIDIGAVTGAQAIRAVASGGGESRVVSGGSSTRVSMLRAGRMYARCARELPQGTFNVTWAYAYCAVVGGLLDPSASPFPRWREDMIVF